MIEEMEKDKSKKFLLERNVDVWRIRMEELDKVLNLGNYPGKILGMKRIELAIQNEDLRKGQVVLLMKYEAPAEDNDLKHTFIFGWYEQDGTFTGKYSTVELTDHELWVRLIPDLKGNKLPSNRLNFV